tara:strand:+ start:235 stop:387 length:153 start_codon:yes stop_codon:yes gene_type:complete
MKSQVNKLNDLYKALAIVFDDNNEDIDNFNYRLVYDLMAHVNEVKEKLEK